MASDKQNAAADRKARDAELRELKAIRRSNTAIEASLKSVLKEIRGLKNSGAPRPIVENAPAPAADTPNLESRSVVGTGPWHCPVHADMCPYSCGMRTELSTKQRSTVDPEHKNVPVIVGDGHVVGVAWREGDGSMSVSLDGEFAPLLTYSDHVHLSLAVAERCE